eukprot:233499-Chlamydomonas_euryale.AAC.5
MVVLAGRHHLPVLCRSTLSLKNAPGLRHEASSQQPRRRHEVPEYGTLLAGNRLHVTVTRQQSKCRGGRGLRPRRAYAGHAACERVSGGCSCKRRQHGQVAAQQLYCWVYRGQGCNSLGRSTGDGITMLGGKVHLNASQHDGVSNLSSCKMHQQYSDEYQATTTQPPHTRPDAPTVSHKHQQYRMSTDSIT